jgi:hypothetical protein
MVSISVESTIQTEARLARVIQSAIVTWFDQPYTFIEYPIADMPRELPEAALACVRDDTSWSVLAPAHGDSEKFRLFRFHFPANLDNSGFVGWLAGRFKQRFGTGVFVVCGQNAKKGGIYDYWGVPESIADDVVRDVKNLMLGIESSAAPNVQ